MIRFNLFGLFFLQSLLCIGQNTIISGTAKGFEGKDLRVFTQPDPISQEINIDAVSTIDSVGSFSLALNTDDITNAWIAINRYTAPLYMEPNTTYHIEISSGDQTIMVDTWQQGELQYTMNSLDSSDINVLIATFDAALFDFFTTNAALIGSRNMRDKMIQFEKTWTETPIQVHRFFKTYVKYTVAQMKLSSGFPKKTLFDTYLKNESWHFNNPAWYGFLDLFFANYFDAFDSKFGGAAIHNRMTMGLSPDSLNKLLLADDFLQDEKLRHLIIVKSVAESLYNNKYPKEPLIEVVNWIKVEADAQVVHIAKAVLDEYERRTKHIHIDELNLPFESHSPLPWNGIDSLKTYLITTATWSSESKKELELLKNLKEKYPETFHILHVELDDNKRESPFWKTSPAQQVAYLDLLGIYSIPHATWIDKNGMINRSGPAPKPSEGLESELFRIQSKFNERDKIRIGQ